MGTTGIIESPYDCFETNCPQHHNLAPLPLLALVAPIMGYLLLRASTIDNPIYLTLYDAGPPLGGAHIIVPIIPC